MTTPNRLRPLGLARTGAVVGLGTAASRITGLVRVGVLAYAIGFTRLSDSYNIANTTPNIVYELLLGGVLSATLLPIFVSQFDDENDDGISAIFTISMLALTGLVIAGILTAPWIVDLYAHRLHGPEARDQAAVMVVLLRLFMPQIFFYGFTALASALLNARHRFSAAAIVPALNNVVVIAVLLAIRIWVTGTPQIHDVRNNLPLLLFIGLGTTAGIVIMALALIPALRTCGVRLRFRPDWRHPAVFAMFRLSGWTLGYVIENQVALWIVMVLALRHAGDLSAYQTAFVFFQLPHGLFAVSIMTALGPRLAESADNPTVFRQHMQLGLRLIVRIVAPAAAGYIVLARPVVGVLLDHGAFSTGSAITTAEALSGFAVGLVPFSVYLYALRCFYAHRDARTPFFLNAFQNACNIVLAFILLPTFEIRGLALAFSISYAIAALIALRLLSQRMGSSTDHRTWRSLRHSLVATIGMALMVSLIDHMFIQSLGSSERLAIGVLTGFVVYGAVLQLLRRPLRGA